ncbi:hypothetical protein GOQ27_16330 [Clostridium sp. D2Q-11]|uniref:YtxH-like protein n=1 Tax=Anaeromonas frigoriresistens TaxID=2683708 RepID=A0A942V1A4_9FIRM|nr:hypothetical protein [Anaeromonas frigoriresistens]MBS4540046.1 hypothetical protein [Anaeromonas frigoriresistens]
MNNKLVNGIITGTIISAVGMYASSKMSPRQKRKMMKRSKKMFTNAMDNMNMF